MVSLEDAYSKWADELVGYATTITSGDDAADIVADTFAVLLKHGEPDWSRIRDPRAYLLRCVFNTAQMRGRADGRRRAREDGAARLSPRPSSAVDPAPGDLPAGDPQMAKLLNRLSLQQRAVIYLTYWDDLAPRQVAEVLGISVGAVKRQLARARAKLRKELS